MRFKSRTPTAVYEGDFTPMIDMTFQLIAFFALLLNFSQVEQNERIQLPSSELAKPNESPLDYPITLQLTREGNVIIGGQEIPPAALRPYLIKEKQLLQSQGRPVADATVIIRAHKDAVAGIVQELIDRCQREGLERFALRAKEDVKQ
jgi:biopolymer transport protein ExbD